jgi:starch synthase
VPRLMSARDFNLVVLGSGAARYEAFFARLQQLFPARVHFHSGYSDELAHWIEGASDMFLMPSRYEPCGLNQIYSLRYGTVPVVRATGGLDDTIQNFSPKTHQGTGFKFDEYSGGALLVSIRAALKAYRDPKLWQAIQATGMAKDYSWKSSAAAYVTLYEAAKRARIPRVVGSSK